MSKNAELNNLFYSFSGDSTLTAHTRSGDAAERRKLATLAEGANNEN